MLSLGIVQKSLPIERRRFEDINWRGEHEGFFCLMDQADGNLVKDNHCVSTQPTAKCSREYILWWFSGLWLLSSDVPTLNGKCIKHVLPHDMNKLLTHINTEDPLHEETDLEYKFKIYPKWEVFEFVFPPFFKSLLMALWALLNEFSSMLYVACELCWTKSLAALCS